MKPANVQLVRNPYPHSVHPYEVDAPDDLDGAMVAGSWSPELTRFLVESRIPALYLNTARGWNGNRGDYGFLAELSQLKLLSLLASDALDLSPLERLSALERLSLQCATRRKIDFAALPKLRSVSLTWWAGAASILAHHGVESLTLISPKPRDWAQLSGSTQLKKLRMMGGNVAELDFLRGWPNLAQLELQPARALRRVSGVNSLPALRYLAIDEAHGIEDLDAIAGCKTLEALNLRDLGRIPTLRFLSDLTNLKVLFFSGSTNVEDGDLSFLDELPRLSMLHFAPRRHYSHRPTRATNWNQFGLLSGPVAERVKSRVH